MVFGPVRAEEHPLDEVEEEQWLNWES
jgi:hypothetical protein